MEEGLVVVATNTPEETNKKVGENPEEINEKLLLETREEETTQEESKIEEKPEGGNTKKVSDNDLEQKQNEQYNVIRLKANNIEKELIKNLVPSIINYTITEDIIKSVFKDKDNKYVNLFSIKLNNFFKTQNLGKKLETQTENNEVAVPQTGGKKGEENYDDYLELDDEEKEITEVSYETNNIIADLISKFQQEYKPSEGSNINIPSPSLNDPLMIIGDGQQLNIENYVNETNDEFMPISGNSFELLNDDDIKQIDTTNDPKLKDISTDDLKKLRDIIKEIILFLRLLNIDYESMVLRKEVTEEDKIIYKIYFRIYFKILQGLKTKDVKQYQKLRKAGIYPVESIEELTDDTMERFIALLAEDQLLDDDKSFSLYVIEAFIEMSCETNDSELCTKYFEHFIKPALKNRYSFNSYKKDFLNKLTELAKMFDIKDKPRMNKIVGVIRDLQEITSPFMTNDQIDKLQKNIISMLQGIKIKR